MKVNKRTIYNEETENVYLSSLVYTYLDNLLILKLEMEKYDVTIDISITGVI